MVRVGQEGAGCFEATLAGIKRKIANQPCPHEYGGTLDGAPLTNAASTLNVVAREAPPTLRTNPEARYERFEQVVAVIRRATVTHLGFE